MNGTADLPLVLSTQVADTTIGRAERSWWARWTRTTSSGRFLPAIDGLRCLAIMTVIMHHLGGYVAQRTPGLDYLEAKQSPLYRLIDIGNCGVQLFFVISGFILALPFAEQYLCRGKPVRLKQYFWRRVTRLHPPYLVNLVLLTLLLMLVKNQTWSELGPHLLASALYLHNLVYQSMSTVNGVAWSLEIEVQFYLLAPLLAQVYRIPQLVWRRGLLLLGATSVMLTKCAVGHGIDYPLAGSVFFYLDYFLCGLLLADWQAVLETDRPLSRAHGVVWDLVGLIAAMGCVVLPLNGTTWFLLPVALLPACAAVLRGPRLNRLLSQPVLVVIGGMCYTTYLYHFGVISLVGGQVAPWTSGMSYPAALAFQAAIVIPAILAVSSVLFILVEQPCMRWGRKPVQPVIQPA